MLFLKLLALCYTLGLTFPLSALISYAAVRLLKVISVDVSANSEVTIFVELLTWIIIFHK